MEDFDGKQVEGCIFSLALVPAMKDDGGFVIDVFVNDENVHGISARDIVVGERLEGTLRLQGCLAMDD